MINENAWKNINKILSMKSNKLEEVISLNMLTGIESFRHLKYFVILTSLKDNQV